jgi:acyl carrier protein
MPLSPAFFDSTSGRTVHKLVEEITRTMNQIDIERDIRRFVIDHFLSGRAERLRDDQSLLGSVIDSTGTIELVTYLQEHFAITVEDEDVVPENLDSVKNVVTYVVKKVNART